MRRRYTDANTYGTPNDDNKALLSQRKKGSSRLQAHTTNTSKYVSDHICMHTHTKEMFRLLHGRLRNASSTSRAAFFFPTVNRARTATLEHAPYNFNQRHTMCTENLSLCVFHSAHSHLQCRIECLSYSARGLSSRNVYTTKYDRL
jgi:hypothetical protein